MHLTQMTTCINVNSLVVYLHVMCCRHHCSGFIEQHLQPAVPSLPHRHQCCRCRIPLGVQEWVWSWSHWARFYCYSQRAPVSLKVQICLPCKMSLTCLTHCWVIGNEMKWKKRERRRGKYYFLFCNCMFYRSYKYTLHHVLSVSTVLCQSAKFWLLLYCVHWSGLETVDHMEIRLLLP